MKDTSASIFRSLETTGGRDGFDTIVTAAVADYGALRAPGEARARGLGRLVAPVWHKLAPETKRALAAALSHSPRVPREIVDNLLDAPIEIAAPFLLSSPCLDPDDLARLQASPDERVRKLVAGRQTAPTAAPAKPSARDRQPGKPVDRTPSAISSADRASLPISPAPFIGLPAEQPPSPVSPVSADSVPNMVPSAQAETPTPPAPPTGRTADSVRETLRRLPLAGRTPPGALPAGPPIAALVDLARARNADRFYAFLAIALSMTAERLEQVAADPGGEHLAVALKALQAGPADAMTILMMLKPAVGLDVTAFEAMKASYRALRPADCMAVFDTGKRRMIAASPALQPQFADLAGLNRPVPRAQFGRRKSRPADRSDFGKTG